MIDILSARAIDSPFRRLDPRVRLLWMLVMSVLAMIWIRPEPLTLLIFTLVPVWIAAKLTKSMIASSIRLIPYLFFLLLLQVVPRFIFGGLDEVYLFRFWGMDLSPEELMKGVVETLRFFIMLQSAQVLLQTTDFGELTAGIRQAIPFEVKGTKRFTEIIAFLLGIAYQSVPLLAAEINTMAEVQRARGVDVTKGGRLQQVKKLVRMGVPLFIRSLELAKGSSLALLNYAFSPTQTRSVYRELKMKRPDWIGAGGVAALLLISAGVKSLWPTL